MTNSDQNSGTAEVRTKKNRAPWPFITIGIFGTVLVMAAIAIAWLQISSIGKAVTEEAQTYNERQGSLFEEYAPGGRNSEDEWFGNGSLQPDLIGAVSATDAKSISVIGGGRKVSVKITRDTRVEGDASEIAVNDSVAVYGFENNDGSLTATHVIIVNEDLFEAPSREQSRPRGNVPSA